MTWTRIRRAGPGPFTAGAAAVLALTLVGVTLRRALDIDLPASAAPVSSMRPGTLLASRPGITDEELAAAADNDPFRPDRQRAAYRFGTVASSGALTTDSEPAPPADARPHLRLAGTVVVPEGRSFAMCEWMAEPPRVVHVGDTIGGYALRSVSQGRAVFRSPSGENVELRVPKAGA